MRIEDLFLGANSLPRNLKEEETIEALQEVKKGNEEAKKKLVEHNIRLVLLRVLVRFRNVNYDLADLVSIGNIGLMKAIATYDLTRRVKFSSYAGTCIDNEILMFLRKLKRNKNIDSLNKTIYADNEGNEMTLEDILSDDVDIVFNYEQKELRKNVWFIVNELPKREKEIIKLHFGFYGKCYTQREIAKILSMSQPYVSRIINNSLEKITRYLELKNLVEMTNESKLKLTKNVK